jgi:hypothetical protein
MVQNRILCKKEEGGKSCNLHSPMGPIELLPSSVRPGVLQKS